MATRTNATTQSILTHLNYNGFVAYRNNNGAVYSVKRKSFLKNPLHKLGVSDIIGFSRADGKFIAVEVKTGKDKLSDEQLEFLEQLKKSGGIAMVAKDYDDFERQFNAMFNKKEALKRNNI